MPTLNTLRGNYEARIRALSAFGHRGSATEHERRAADYLCEELASLGMSPVREPFSGCRSFGPRILVHVLLATVGLLALWKLPLAASALGLVAAISLWVEHSRSVAWLSHPLLRFPSANVVGRFPVANPRLRIVLTGHYDTQRSGFIWFLFAWFGPLFWWVPAFLKPPLMGVWLVMVGQGALGAIAAWHGMDNRLTLAALLIFAIYAVTALLVGQWSIGRFVEGAGDNAAGAAAVLTLGEAWRQDPVTDVELVLLLPGCEEVGLIGSTLWADQHRQEMQEVPTLFLNLDNLGFGPPRFFRCEVPLCGWPMEYPQSMIDAAAETASVLGLEDAGPHAMPGPTDGLALLSRGMTGMSIVSFGKWGFMRAYHRQLDTTGNIDFDAAWQAVEFGEALLRRLASVSSRLSP